MIVKKNAPFLLLEVLVAMMLVTLCLIPLVAPNTVLLQAKRTFGLRIEEKNRADQAYCLLLEKLYLNTLPLEDILQGEMHPLDEKRDVFYRFKIIKQKPEPEKESPPQRGYLLELSLFVGERTFKHTLYLEVERT